MAISEMVSLKTGFLDLVSKRLCENPRCYFIGFDVSRHRLNVPNAIYRICDMPIAEESILGIAVGMSRAGSEVFVDLMFEAFAFRTMDVLINQIALSTLIPRIRRELITVRMICGPFPGAGPQHGSTGYALFARLPNVSVAAPCIAADIAVAYQIAVEQKKPLLLVMMGESISSTLPVTSYLDSSQVRVFGTGTRLAIISSGLHAPLLLKAVLTAGVIDSVRILTPLLLAPLPVELLLDRAGEVENLLIIDGSPPPTTIGDMFAAQAYRRRGCCRITFHSIWDHGVGADYDEDVCIRSLAQMIVRLL